jgi:hypothetical protein
MFRRLRSLYLWHELWCESPFRLFLARFGIVGHVQYTGRVRVYGVREITCRTCGRVWHVPAGWVVVDGIVNTENL